MRADDQTPEQRRKAQLAQMLRSHPGLAPKGAMLIGYMMEAWLSAAVVDEGTSVDTGAGFDAFDLWATVEGEEYLVTIKKQPPAKQPGPDAIAVPE